MTVLIAEVSIDQFDYEVEYDGFMHEFGVYRVLVPGVSRQIGDPIPADRPLYEYTNLDYEQFVYDALATHNEN